MSVSWCVSYVAVLPVSYLVCSIPRYRAVRSHEYFHVSAHANYISAIIWRSHEGWPPASTGETTNWMMATSEPQVDFASWLLQHQLNINTFFSGTVPSSLLKLLFSSNRSLFFFFISFARLLWLWLLQHLVLANSGGSEPGFQVCSAVVLAVG